MNEKEHTLIAIDIAKTPCKCRAKLRFKQRQVGTQRTAQSDRKE